MSPQLSEVRGGAESPHQQEWEGIAISEDARGSHDKLLAGTRSAWEGSRKIALNARKPREQRCAVLGETWVDRGRWAS